MSDRPRVTASAEYEPVSNRSICGQLDIDTPGVRVDVEFDLHDHESALALLDMAVADVRAKIEETK